MGNLIALKYFQVVDPEKSGELITVQPGEPCCELPEAKKAQYLELGIIGREGPEPVAPSSPGDDEVVGSPPDDEPITKTKPEPEPEPVKAPVKRATKKAPAKTPPKPKRKRATKKQSTKRAKA